MKVLHLLLLPEELLKLPEFRSLSIRSSVGRQKTQVCKRLALARHLRKLSVKLLRQKTISSLRILMKISRLDVVNEGQIPL